MFDFSRTFRGVNTDFFFNFSNIFLISPTSDLSDFLLNRAVRAVSVIQFIANCTCILLISIFKLELSPFPQKNFFYKAYNHKHELPGRPCLLMDRDEMSNLYRGPSIDASYQVSVQLTDGCQVMAKAHIAFGKLS